MKILRALVGIPVLFMVIVLLILIFVASVLMIGMSLLFLGAVFFATFICVIAPVFIFLFTVSTLEFIPAIIRKKSIWGCQTGKALFRRMNDFLSDLCDSVVCWWDNCYVILDKPADLAWELNDWFGTSKLIGDVIEKMNMVCRGEYKKATPIAEGESRQW